MRGAPSIGRDGNCVMKTASIWAIVVNFQLEVVPGGVGKGEEGEGVIESWKIDVALWKNERRRRWKRRRRRNAQHPLSSHREWRCYWNSWEKPNERNPRRRRRRRRRRRGEIKREK